MKLRKGKRWLPSEEIKKGAQLMSMSVFDGCMLFPVMLISLEEMGRLNDDGVRGRPVYAAVNPVRNNIVIFPKADRDYQVRQLWQLQYEVL